jgi:hypothetical protein
VADLSMIYITADVVDASAELRCTAHPKWWADADGTNLPDAVRNAISHFTDEHRVHVTSCMCRDRVTDGRCVPHPGIAITGSSSPSGGEGRG